MDGRFAPWLIQQWIDEVEAMDKWCALFFGDPLTNDPASVEVIGGAYARVQPAWDRSSPYSLTLAEEAVWRALAPGTTVSYVGLMQGAFSNVLIARERLATPRSYPAGGTLPLEAGQWVIGLSVPVIT